MNPEKSSGEAASYSVSYLSDYERSDIIDKLENFSSITVSREGWTDLGLLVSGAYLPFRGFGGKSDYEDSLRDLAAGSPPFLAVDGAEAEEVEIGDDVVIRDTDGKNIALLKLAEKFRIYPSGVSPVHGGARTISEDARDPEVIEVALTGNIGILRLESVHRGVPDSRRGRRPAAEPNRRER